MPAPQGLALPPQRGRQAITGRAANVLTLPYHEVRALYFENPRFGFYFLQLASGRLLKDKARAEDALAAERAASAAKAR
jgi:hypothetical protein